MSIDVSIVIPILDEREALPGLIEELAAACADIGSWEAVLVDDGSTDGSWGEIAQLATARPEVRGLRLRRNFGKSAALATGIDAARGKTIVTIDGDGQDDPAEIPRLSRSWTTAWIWSQAGSRTARTRVRGGLPRASSTG